MPYALTSDLINRFGLAELTQLTDTGSGIDTARIDGAGSDASDEIDTYLGTRYTLPLASVPPVLVRLACDIARYRLYDVAATAEVRNRYNDAIGLLKLIANGTATLGSPLDDEPTVADLPLATTRVRQFSDDTLSDFSSDFP